jgi:integrase/recombinase XerD
MIEGKSLSQLADEFIAYKKSNGYIYSTAEYYLNSFINHVSTSERATENLPTKDNINSVLN